MQTFTMQPLVDIVGNFSAALGVNAAGAFTSKDVNKAVKLIGDSKYGLVAAGDEIEGTVEAISPFTVNNGLSFGTVNSRGRRVVTIDNVTAVVVGDTVLAGAQAALGTAQTNTVARKGTPTTFVWRVISLLGSNGAAGTSVLIERVNG